MKDSYDIAIIGTGIGGLVAGALLQDTGKSVLFVEKEPRPGGYLTEFARDGCVFDVSLHLLNACGEGELTHDIFRRCGISDGLNFVRPRYLYRSVFPDYDLRVPQCAPGEYRDMLITLFPESRGGIDGLFDEMAEAYGAVKGRSSGRSAAGLLKFIASDFGTVIDRHIKDARLKAILCQLWIYMGLPPSKLRAIDFIYPFFDYLSGGGYYLEKGSYEIVRNLESRIRDNGGVFMLGCRARSVSRSGQGPYRIDLDSGSVYCDTLVSNIDAAGTLRMFGEDAFCPESAERIGSITPSISAFEIFLSIGADLGGRYPDDYEIFINDGYDPEAQYRSCLENDARLSPFVITLNSNLNPFSAPRGRSAVSIIMLSGYGGWKRLSRRDYLDRKDEMAGILIERASKVIPEIGSAVRHVTVSTPVTFERYTGNSCGAIYGYSGVFARRPGIRLNDLPGRGDLYFASAWAGQGSGVAKVLGAADEVYRKVSEKSIERSLA